MFVVLRLNLISPVYLNIACFDYDLDSDSALCTPETLNILANTFAKLRDVGG